MLLQFVKIKFFTISLCFIVSVFVFSNFSILSYADVSDHDYLFLKASNNLSNMNSSKPLSDTFSNLFVTMTQNSKNLTSHYNQEILLWQKGKYSNITMAKITETYLPQFVAQLSKFNSSQVPLKYEKIKENFITSLHDEVKSYELFKDYLLTGNKTKDNLSTDYLSNSFKYEELAFKEFNDINEK